jgi:hypothetical protein
VATRTGYRKCKSYTRDLILPTSAKIRYYTSASCCTVCSKLELAVLTVPEQLRRCIKTHTSKALVSSYIRTLDVSAQRGSSFLYNLYIWWFISHTKPCVYAKSTYTPSTVKSEADYNLTTYVSMSDITISTLTLLVPKKIHIKPFRARYPSK